MEQIFTAKTLHKYYRKLFFAINYNLSHFKLSFAAFYFKYFICSISCVAFHFHHLIYIISFAAFHFLGLLAEPLNLGPVIRYSATALRDCTPQLHSATALCNYTPELHCVTALTTGAISPVLYHA